MTFLSSTILHRRASSGDPMRKLADISKRRDLMEILWGAHRSTTGLLIHFLRLHSVGHHPLPGSDNSVCRGTKTEDRLYAPSHMLGPRDKRDGFFSSMSKTDHQYGSHPKSSGLGKCWAADVSLEENVVIAGEEDEGVTGPWTLVWAKIWPVE